MTNSPFSRHSLTTERLRPRRRKLVLAALIAVTALPWVGGPVSAQTAGTAGPAPDVAPVITSPPTTIVSPGSGNVISAAPTVISAAPGVAPAGAISADAPAVASAIPPNVAPEVASNVVPAVASNVAPQVVIPSGLPRTGDGSMLESVSLGGEPE